MIPIVLSFIFTAKRWYSIEFGNDNKIYTGPWYTIPFLLLQVYPPFLACKLIYLLIKKDRRYLEAKRLYDGNVSTIGKYMLDQIIITYLSYVQCLTIAIVFELIYS